MLTQGRLKRKFLHKKKVQFPQTPVHLHGRRFVVLKHQYGRRDIMLLRSIVVLVDSIIISWLLVFRRPCTLFRISLLIFLKVFMSKKMKYRVFQKFVPIVNCILHKAFNASWGKCKLIQVGNLSK